MHISLIAAKDKNNGIGHNNTIPWMGKTPRDMRHFREHTTGHTVIMGRNTFLSMNARPLPNRTNIVVSRTLGAPPDGVRIAASLGEALRIASDSGETEVFIIGGAMLYKEALPLADRCYITEVGAEFIADTRFPDLPQEEWEIANDELFPADEKNLYPLRFVTLTRKTA